VKIGNPLDLFRTGASTTGAAAPDADKAGAVAAPAQPATVPGSATVKLSGGLARLKASGTAEDAFDAGRVDQLKAAIADGSFKVNADTVAGKVISSNLEALTRSKA
jgi:negative regulator of flagellin synthesis FlgM